MSRNVVFLYSLKHKRRSPKEIAADRGRAQAQCNLGIAYEHGECVQQDYAEAVRMHQSNANQGLAIAQHNIVILYDNERGIAKNDIEAASKNGWLLEASTHFPGRRLTVTR